MGRDKGSRVFFEVYMKQKQEGEASPEQKPLPTTEETKDTTTDAIETDDVSQQEVVSSQAQETKPEPSFYRPETPDLKPSTYQKIGSSHVPPQSLSLARDDVPVRYDTIIYAALGAVFLSVGCFFLGHKLGYDKALRTDLISAEPGKQFSSEDTGGKDLTITTNKTERRKEAVQVATPKTSEATHYQSLLSKKDNWTLQIITYKAGEKNATKATNLANTIKREIGHDAFVAKTPRGLVVCVGKFDSANSAELRTLKKKLSSFEYENKKQFKGCYPVRLR